MSQSARSCSRAALLTTALLAALPAPAALASTPAGPAGDAFYAPPASMLAGPQGSVVWARPSTAIITPREAARATTVIYRSRSVTGAPSFVSGDVLVPRGTPPAGGWPVVAWGHITTGVADRCAPTRATPEETDHGRMIRSRTVTSRLLARGVAVVRTDDEGLGTPGRHPYLVGRSLAQATVDMVRAGRDLDPALSARFVAAGHSEGGVASLYTGALIDELAPELQLRGVAAVAPVMSMRPLFELGRSLDLRIPDATALAALVIDGAGTVDAELDALLDAGALSARAVALRPQLQERCYGDLTRRDSFGGLTPRRMNGPLSTALFPRLLRVVDASDPTRLRFPSTLPVRLDQGDIDPVTWRPLADDFVRAQRRAGADITYRTYPLATHANITDPGFAADPVAAWAAARLR